MLVTYREYPYPVLSYFNDDYIDQTFKSLLNNRIDNGILILDIEVELTSNTLLKLINEGKAMYIVHVECKSTRYRKKFISDINKFNINISQDDVDNDIEVLVMVVAKKKITNFISEEFNDDFFGVEFTIEKGDVLAIDTNKIINIEKNDDNIKKSPSIFSIVALDDNKESINWEPDTDKILIKLSKYNFERYKSINNNPQFKSVIATLIVLPVIVEVIANLSDLEQDFEDSRWFKVIERQLRKVNVDIDNINTGSAISIAQKILPGLLEKSLTNIEQLLLQEGE